MIETTIGQASISHVLFDNKISDARLFRQHIKIRILPDGTGWMLLFDNWVEAQFFVNDPIQKLDLNDKAT